MTLPPEIILPLRINYTDEKDSDRYLHDLVFDLQNMYEDIAENVNGSVRNNAEVDQSVWTPTLQGTGAGTFTYATASQIGWSIRQGIFTELFFDITWSSTTATGNLYLELPYIAARSSGMPFKGSLQPSSIIYGVGVSSLTINAIPATSRGEIWSTGSTLATANFSVVASGRLIGHIRYIGQEDERRQM